MAVAEAALREASQQNDALVNVDLVRKWLASGLGWLLLFPSIGVLISTKFNYPEFLGDTAWLTFGRLRPMHVNGVIWGAFSTLFIGLCYYIVPRLTGVRYRPLGIERFFVDRTVSGAVGSLGNNHQVGRPS